MTGTVERFSDRVENYVKYRPGYPPAMLQFFKERLGLTTDSVIADIGSGTGISDSVISSGSPQARTCHAFIVFTQL